MKRKHCHKCGKMKSIDAFSKDASRKDGRDPYCKECKQQYYKENKASFFERQHEYNRLHRKEISENKRRYYKDNAVKICQYKRQYRKDHPEQMQSYDIQRQRYYRNAIIDTYGGKCERCSEQRQRLLVIHHKNNDGNEHRAEVGASTRGFYIWLIRQNFPRDNYELICRKCHLREHIRLRKEKTNV